MKKSEIKVIGYYRARINGHLVTFRLDEIVTTYANKYHKGGTHYRVTNLRTGRKVTFRSALKFRLETNESEVPA